MFVVDRELARSPICIGGKDVETGRCEVCVRSRKSKFESKCSKRELRKRPIAFYQIKDTPAKRITDTHY